MANHPFEKFINKAAAGAKKKEAIRQEKRKLKQEKREKIEKTKSEIKEQKIRERKKVMKYEVQNTKHRNQLTINTQLQNTNLNRETPESRKSKIGPSCL